MPLRAAVNHVALASCRGGRIVCLASAYQMWRARPQRTRS